MKDHEILAQLRHLEEQVMKRAGSKDSTTPRQKRRRIIYSDSEESDSDTGPPVSENVDAAKDNDESNTEDVFSVLGTDPTLVQDFGDEIHAHIAVRWTNILQKGIKKENRMELLKEYLPPSNCTFILPPQLNDEIKAAVQETAIKRDAKLEQKQAQLGAGITCIGKAISQALKIPDKTLRDEVIKYLGESGQILSDLHYLESQTRRSLLMQGLNKTTKEAIKDLPRDKLLFGESLPEKLKVTKACSKFAADLKVKPVRVAGKSRLESKVGGSTLNPPESLNWRGSSRRSMNSASSAGAHRERRLATATAAVPRRAQASHPRQQPAKRF